MTNTASHARRSIAQAGDGEPLSYCLAGRAGKTPILTVHGLVSSTQHWGFFTEHYTSDRPVLSWEYRGHGGQPVPRDHRSASVAQFADDAAAVCTASAVGPVVVTALSFGVQVALELWRRHPGTVRALVLICGTAGLPLDRVLGLASSRRTVVALLRGMGSQPVISRPLLALLRSSIGRRLAAELAFASGGAHREACPRTVLDELFAHVAGLDPALLAEVTASYLEHDAYDMLSTITVPTLIVAGDADQLAPLATAERMQRAISGSRLVVFPGHSHLVQVEKPREVHAAIDAFLTEHAL